MKESVLELFNAHVDSNLDKHALIYMNEHFTYRWLSNRIDFISSLWDPNISDEIIGVILDRSVDMVATIWAVLKSGNAYLPIDPSLPKERISYMLDDCGVNIVLATEKYGLEYSNQYKTIFLDNYNVSLCNKNIITEKIENKVDISSPESLAYVMYTSGTTGRPKGVMVNHNALSNYVINMQDLHPLSPGERVLFKTPFNFDVSIREVIWTLAFGGVLVIAESNMHKDPVYISKLMKEHNVNLAHFVPSMLAVFLRHPDAEFSESINCIISSGEALQIKQVKDFFSASPGARLLNMYGPTEATVEVSAFDCMELDTHSTVPIGRATDNNTLLILNDDLNLCEVGNVGKLYIAGRSLAVGYINDKKLTAESFIWSDIDGVGYLRLYDTGDLARYLPEGNIEYIGREDEQISNYGYRIEPAEINNAIYSHDSVESVYVTVNESSSGFNKIVAYVKVSNVYRDLVKIEDIFNLLRDTLPEYMIPKNIMLIDEFPLTSNGKIDKSKLPVPTAVHSEIYIAPKNYIEKTIHQLWGRNLNNITQRISVLDNYFKLGGDSISLIYLIISINDRFSINILLQDIMDCETIKSMSRLVVNRIKQKTTESDLQNHKWEEIIL